jgi:RNA polymerase sigma-70 factor, ECF subfamily
MHDREATDRACVADLYARWSGDIHSYASRLLGNSAAADDVTQEVFLAVWRDGAGRDPAVPIRAWLYRIASNRCIDQLRRRRLIAWLPLSAWRETAGEADPVGDAAATSDAIRRTLAALPPRDAAVLVLHSAQGLDYREIAAVLKISPAAAASALSRARDRFARHYAPIAEEVCP